MLGLVLFSWWFGPFISFHCQFCSTAEMVRFKQLWSYGVFFWLLSCSWAGPHLFLWTIFNTRVVLVLPSMQWFERRSVGCAHSFPVGLIKEFFLSWCESDTVTHKCSDRGEHRSDCRNSWLLRCDCDPLCHPSSAGLLQPKRHAGEGWCLPKAHLAGPAQALGNAGHHFCSICRKHYHKIVYKTS